VCVTFPKWRFHFGSKKKKRKSGTKTRVFFVFWGTKSGSEKSSLSRLQIFVENRCTGYIARPLNVYKTRREKYGSGIPLSSKVVGSTSMFAEFISTWQIVLDLVKNLTSIFFP
jgi:hypothetical protein